MVIASSPIEINVLNILEDITGTSQVRETLDIALFDEHLLDSFDLMRVILEVSDALHMEISPAEVNREAWATPRKIIAYLQNRLNTQ